MISLEKIKIKLESIFNDDATIAAVHLFGSLATNKTHPGSDVDIALLFDKKYSKHDSYVLREGVIIVENNRDRNRLFMARKTIECIDFQFIVKKCMHGMYENAVRKADGKEKHIVSEDNHIEKNLRRLTAKKNLTEAEFLQNIDAQETVLLNLQQAIQGCIDIAIHICIR